MFESIVYNHLLSSAKNKVTFNALVSHLMTQLTKEDVSRACGGKKFFSKRHFALNIVGGMIANRDISVDDDGRVYIS